MGLLIAFDGMEGIGKSSLIHTLEMMLDNGRRKIITFDLQHLIEYDNNRLLYLCKNKRSERLVKSSVYAIKEAREDLAKVNDHDLTPDNSISFNYNKILYCYIQICREFQEVIKSYIKEDYIVFLDKWLLTPLAYNGGIDGSLIHNIIQESNTNDHIFALPRIPGDGPGYKIKRDLYNLVSDIIAPDILVYIPIVDFRPMISKLKAIYSGIKGIEKEQTFFYTHKVFESIVAESKMKIDRHDERILKLYKQTLITPFIYPNRHKRLLEEVKHELWSYIDVEEQEVE